ncbi:hypothetical protein [uncultured Ruminococcus sp.]|uniref:hypothetical protein n=1 Tax=uncultured Ruminococcus sp. TaxID=165186 RepID=UPI0025D1E123|nr:hypothetical protein [uncultured Ruminococcus sp.]
MKKLHHYTPMLLLTIAASVFMIVTELLVFCNYMVFNTDYYVWVITDSGADSALYNEIDTYFRRLSQPTGIPQEVYTKSLDKKKVSTASKRMTKMALDYTFGKSNAEPAPNYDYTQFETDVTEYIEKYSEANNIEKDAEYYSFIDNTIDVAEKKMDASFDIMMAGKLADSSVPKLTRKVVPTLNYVMGISILVLAGLFGLMYFVDRHHVCDLPYWLGTIMFSGSAVFLIPAVYCRATGYFDGFFMEEQSLYYAITGSIYNVTDRLIIANGILFALGIVLIIFAQVIHVYRIKDARERAHEDED